MSTPLRISLKQEPGDSPWLPPKTGSWVVATCLSFSLSITAHWMMKIWEARSLPTRKAAGAALHLLAAVKPNTLTRTSHPVLDECGSPQSQTQSATGKAVGWRPNLAHTQPQGWEEKGIVGGCRITLTCLGRRQLPDDHINTPQKLTLSSLSIT